MEQLILNIMFFVVGGIIGYLLYKIQHSKKETMSYTDKQILSILYNQINTVYNQVKDVQNIVNSLKDLNVYKQ